MPRRSRRGGVGRTQKFWNFSTFQVADNTTAYVPAGGRIIAVRGANQDADTYSFQVTVASTSALPLTSLQSITYTGVPNGQRVSLKGDFPFLANIGSVATGAGDLSVSVKTGALTSVEVYYSTGAPLIDLPDEKKIFSTGVEMVEEVPAPVRKWLVTNCK